MTTCTIRYEKKVAMIYVKGTMQRKESFFFLYRDSTLDETNSPD